MSKPSLVIEGSAENWVRTKFIKEVGAYRSRHAQTALIVVIDSDTGTVEDRIRQLNQALKDDGKETVKASEQIARLVPKRNIETWILCLNERPVDEETDYKNKQTRDDWNKLGLQAADTLYQLTHQRTEPPEYCVDSLLHGIKELKRLKL